MRGRPNKVTLISKKLYNKQKLKNSFNNNNNIKKNMDKKFKLFMDFKKHITNYIKILKINTNKITYIKFFWIDKIKY